MPSENAAAANFAQLYGARWGNAHLGTDRGDVYDTPLTTTHVREYRHRGADSAPEHHAHSLLEIFDCRGVDRAYVDDAGIIHQNIDAAEVIQSRRHQRLNLQAIAYVARGGEYFRPGPSKIFCRPIKFFLAAGAQYKFRVLLREPSGERKTQTM